MPPWRCCYAVGWAEPCFSPLQHPMLNRLRPPNCETPNVQSAPRTRPEPPCTRIEGRRQRPRRQVDVASVPDVRHAGGGRYGDPRPADRRRCDGNRRSHAPTGCRDRARRRRFPRFRCRGWRPAGARPAAGYGQLRHLDPADSRYARDPRPDGCGLRRCFAEQAPHGPGDRPAEPVRRALHGALGRAVAAGRAGDGRCHAGALRLADGLGAGEISGAARRPQCSG